MFSKIFTSTALVLALCLQQANAHAAISPALGVSGTPVRNNVKRPSNANPCGAGVNIASAIDSSTAVAANAAGSFNAVAINFNGGADSSRRVTAKVDATGTGQNFVAMTVTTNGDATPANTGSQPIVASLPAGTECTGGSTGNKCLVQFTTSAGFGNCVVVSQGAAAAGDAAAGGATAGGATPGTAGTGTTGTTTTTTTNTGTGRNRGANRGGRNRGGQNGAAAAAAGTRAPRSLLAELEARGEEAVSVVKRGITSWIWA